MQTNSSACRPSYSKLTSRCRVSLRSCPSNSIGSIQVWQWPRYIHPSSTSSFRPTSRCHRRLSCMIQTMNNKLTATLSWKMVSQLRKRSTWTKIARKAQSKLQDQLPKIPHQLVKELLQLSEDGSHTILQNTSSSMTTGSSKSQRTPYVKHTVHTQQSCPMRTSSYGGTTKTWLQLHLAAIIPTHPCPSASNR